MRVLIHHPDGSKSRLSNVFLHDEGYLCRWREEAQGLVRTNWTKAGDTFVLAVEPTEVQFVCEPVVCPGKAYASNLDMGALQARMDACRMQKDYSSLMMDAQVKPLFYTLGENGGGYKVEVL